MPRMFVGSRFQPKARLSIAILFQVAAIVLLLAACSTTEGPGFEYDRSIARFHFEADQGTIATLPVSGARIQVSPNTAITEFDIVDVQIVEVELGRCLAFSLTRRAARAFYQESANNLGRRLVLIIDGRPIGVRRVNAPIADGVVYIFLEVPDSSLDGISMNLKGTSIEIQKKLNP